MLLGRAADIQCQHAVAHGRLLTAGVHVLAGVAPQLNDLRVGRALARRCAALRPRDGRDRAEIEACSVRRWYTHLWRRAVLAGRPATGPVCSCRWGRLTQQRRCRQLGQNGFRSLANVHGRSAAEHLRLWIDVRSLASTLIRHGRCKQLCGTYAAVRACCSRAGLARALSHIRRI